MSTARAFAVAAAIGVCSLACGGAPAQDAQPKPPIPIVYSTDLYHPHDDPDDHFDLMTLFAVPEFDIVAIVIDTGGRGKDRPGIPALEQVMRLAGREVPYATGLTGNLKTREDAGEDQPEAAQAGVDLILDVLRDSVLPVTVFTTGSLRDVAAAYNRDPEVFNTKVGRVYVNAGHSGGKGEWNVNLDPHAFVRILRSGLPVYWVPCFGEAGYASLWQFKHGDVLAAAPKPVGNFFVYALTKADPRAQDPIAALAANPPQDLVDRLWGQERRMWCTAAFLHAAGRPHSSFSFEDVTVRVEDDGSTQLLHEEDPLPGGGDRAVRLRTFHVAAQNEYSAAMLQCLKQLFAAVETAQHKLR